jgi:hypothetical protein
MQTVRHESDEFAFFGGAHIHQHGVAGLDERPRILRRQTAGIRQSGFGGRRTGNFKQRVGGSFCEFKRHDVSFDIARVIRAVRAVGESNRL